MSTTNDDRGRDRVLEEIAKRSLNVPTLATRSSDQLDFHDVAVWCVREALIAAYDAGRKRGPLPRTAPCPRCGADVTVMKITTNEMAAWANGPHDERSYGDDHADGETNEERARRAERALDAYPRLDETDVQCRAVDLIADLLHHVQVHGLEADDVVRMAVDHYEAERMEAIDTGEPVSEPDDREPSNDPT